MNTWIKENPLILAGLAVLAIGIVPKILSGEFQKDAAVSAQLTADRKAQQMKNRQLEIQRESQKEQEAIANERYKGCLVVVASHNRTKATGIQIGQPILDGATPGAMLADGKTVCDQDGLTAEIVNGIASNPAVTTDRAVVEKRLRAFGYDGTLNGKLHYSAPKQ